MYKKLKSLIANELIFTSLLLCCVAVTSFLLGQASVTAGVQNASTDVPRVQLVAVAETPSNSAVFDRGTATGSVPREVSKQTIVASKSGTKYHFVTCPGAKQIKEENKIYFDTVAGAEAAGYSKAANCPGL